MAMSEQDWQHKIQRSHEVRFTPVGGRLAGAEITWVMTRAQAALKRLGYDPTTRSSFSVRLVETGVGPAHRHVILFEYWDTDRLDLDRWESAVLYALAHAGASGEVEKRTRVDIVP